MLAEYLQPLMTYTGLSLNGLLLVGIGVLLFLILLRR